jgi:hypothetical protein
MSRRYAAVALIGTVLVASVHLPGGIPDEASLPRLDIDTARRHKRQTSSTHDPSRASVGGMKFCLFCLPVFSPPARAADGQEGSRYCRSGRTPSHTRAGRTWAGWLDASGDFNSDFGTFELPESEPLPSRISRSVNLPACIIEHLPCPAPSKTWNLLPTICVFGILLAKFPSYTAHCCLRKIFQRPADTRRETGLRVAYLGGSCGGPQCV